VFGEPPSILVITENLALSVAPRHNEKRTGPFTEDSDRRSLEAVSTG